MRPAVPLLAVVATGTLLALLGCSATPPPAWASGGARLALGDAHVRFDDNDVVLDRAGRVTVGGGWSFSLDVAGRVYDSDGDPAGVLLPDGHLVGNDETSLGRVGITNASPPGSETAWLSVSPGGDVVFFDADGDRHAGGHWTGCAGPVLRTCTLVTHLVALQRALVAQQSRMSFGVGVGIYR